MRRSLSQLIALALAAAHGMAASAPTEAHPLDCEVPALECEGALGSAFGLGLGQQGVGPFCAVDGRRFLEGFVYEISVNVTTEITLEQDTNPDSMSTVFLLTECETDSCAAFVGGEDGSPLTACVEPGLYYAIIVATDPLNAPATFNLTLHCASCQLVPARRSTWGLLKTGYGGARDR